jgi:hypothetical protein
MALDGECGAHELGATRELFKAADATAPRRELFDVSRRVSAPGGSEVVQRVVTVHSYEDRAAFRFLGGSWRAEPQQALRTQVSEAEPVFVTITF